MAKGQRLPVETKMVIAARAWNGEDPTDLAGEFGIAESTVNDYKSKYPKKRTVKRRVATKVAPKENTRVSASDERIRELEIERDIWKTAYMAVIKHRD